MTVIKRMLCLANSRKPQGRCLAGVIYDGDDLVWLRPVSDREHGEVSEYERGYEDGGDPKVLDIIDVPLIEPRPKNYQQENWLLAANEYWVRVGQLPRSDLEGFVVKSGPLWINGHNTYHGVNDEIPEADANKLMDSLRLIKVESVGLKVFKPNAAFNNPKRRVQAQFTFSGVNYWLWVTDPVYERMYLAQPDGEYNVGETYLTISIGEPFNGSCYKLVAALL